MDILKPFDVVVALKIGCNERISRIVRQGGLWQQRDQSIGSQIVPTNSVGDLSGDLFKSKGEISRSMGRLIALGLIGERRPKEGDPMAANRKYYSLQRAAMAELLCHGIRYVFAPAKSGVGRGVPTGWSCPQVKSPMNPPEMAQVWASPGGNAQGELLEPLYSGVPKAAERDVELYSALALLDVIRVGKPRELKHAQDALAELIGDLHS